MVHRARAVAATALLGGLAWALAGGGLVEYDALYALVSGRDVGHGTRPDYDVTLAPTPHPLATLGGVVLAPLSTAADRGVHGEAATTVVLVHRTAAAPLRAGGRQCVLARHRALLSQVGGPCTLLRGRARGGSCHVTTPARDPSLRPSDTA